MSKVDQMASDLLQIGYKQALNEMSKAMLEFNADVVTKKQLASALIGLYAKCETMTYESFKQGLLKPKPECK